jgi:hypothetical protein
MIGTRSLLIAILLCGCSGPGSLSKDELAAIDACLNYSTEAFPEIDPTSDQPGIKMGDIDQSKFHRSENGEFEYRYPSAWPDKGADHAFICRGNISLRVITHITSGAEVVRPSADQSWSF